MNNAVRSEPHPLALTVTLALALASSPATAQGAAEARPLQGAALAELLDLVVGELVRTREQKQAQWAAISEVLARAAGGQLDVEARVTMRRHPADRAHLLWLATLEAVGRPHATLAEIDACLLALASGKQQRQYHALQALTALRYLPDSAHEHIHAFLSPDSRLAPAAAALVQALAVSYCAELPATPVGTDEESALAFTGASDVDGTGLTAFVDDLIAMAKSDAGVSLMSSDIDFLLGGNSRRCTSGPYVWESAFAALSALGVLADAATPVFCELAVKATHQKQQEALRVLGQIAAPDPAVAASMRKVVNAKGKRMVRELAMLVLASQGKAARSARADLEPLLKADLITSFTVAAVLGEIAPESKHWREHLIRHLTNDSDYDYQNALNRVIQVQKWSRTHAPAKPLHPVLLQLIEPGQKNRRSKIGYVSQLRVPGLEAQLRRYAQDDASPGIRQEALDGLERLSKR